MIVALIGQLRRHFQRRALQEARFSFLFDPPPPDEYVSLDCETTGLDTKKDRILSIGAVRIRNNCVETSKALHLFVQPGKEISAESIKIHHLRHCDMAGAMPIGEAVERLLYFIGSRPLVGYHLSFDRAMINNAVKPHIGTTLPNEMIEVAQRFYRHKMRTAPQGYIDLRFDTILKELDLPVLGKHSALNDAVMTALIFVKLNSTRRAS
jgi:DNA polymerase-3 subunit epsilon